MLLFAGLLAFLGCEKDLEYDLPGATPRLVVNSLICNDSLIRVEISISASPGDKDQIQSLRNAELALYENDAVIRDFILDSLLAAPLDFQGNPIASVAPTKLYFHKTIGTHAQSGRPYRLDVTFPGLATVHAVGMVPRPVRLKTVQQLVDESITVNGTSLSKLEFEIDDNGNEENYYGLEVLMNKPGSEEAPAKILFFSAEKSLAEYLVSASGQHTEGVYYQPSNGVYFSNGKFKGKHKTFTIYVDPSYMGSQYQLSVRVLTLSRDYFEFATSYQKQKANANNPFAEPTQVYSNIQGGLGIFAGYSVSEAQF